MQPNNNTVTTRGSVKKHTLESARRLVRIMTSEKTSPGIRQELRAALARFAACTDFDRRKSLTRAENVAAVLSSVSIYNCEQSEAHRAAFAARVALVDVLCRYDRTENPHTKWLWDAIKKADASPARRATRARKVSRASILRGMKIVILPQSPSKLTMRAAA